VVDAQVERQLVATATWLGVTAFDAGRSEEALPYLETVLRYAPDDVGARDRLAQWHLNRGEDAEALPHLRMLADASVAYDERFALTLRRVEYGVAASDACSEGVRASAEGRFEGAIDALRRATREAPGFGEAWLALADVLLEAGRIEEAIEAYQGAIEFQAGPAAVAGLEAAQSRLEAEEEAALAAASASPPVPAAEASDVTASPPAASVQPPGPTPRVDPLTPQPPPEPVPTVPVPPPAATEPVPPTGPAPVPTPPSERTPVPAPAPTPA